MTFDVDPEKPKCLCERILKEFSTFPQNQLQMYHNYES